MKISNLGYYIFGFFNQRFLIEFFYNKYIVEKVLLIGGQTTKVLDKGSVEWIGPFGLNVVLTRISKIISSLNQGVVTNYALYFVIATCFYLLFFTGTFISFDTTNASIVTCLLVLLVLNYLL
jgi:NADH-ubiquinone oxidoreductase chain 5